MFGAGSHPESRIQKDKMDEQKDYRGDHQIHDSNIPTLPLVLRLQANHLLKFRDRRYGET